MNLQEFLEILIDKQITNSLGIGLDRGRLKLQWYPKKKAMSLTRLL